MYSFNLDDLRRFPGAIASAIALSLGLTACSGDDTGESSATLTSTSSTTAVVSESDTEPMETETGDPTNTTDTNTTTETTTESGGVAYDFEVVTGFAVPESCLWDPETQQWYVSNIAPQSQDFTAPDGVGWISRLDANGAIIEEKWVEGFDTPAGLRIAGDVLLVNDIKRVHEVDRATGTVLLTHEFPDAVLLNDPAVDMVAGIGYATDTFGNAIYQFQLGDLGNDELFLADPALLGPNGLLYADGTLYVASLVDFMPENLGPVLRVDVATKQVAQFGTLLGKFDGLEPWMGGFMVSDNPNGTLILLDQEGNDSLFIDLLADHGFAPAADHGVDEAGGVICVPDLNESVGFIRLQ